jgi:hypothetical protein
VVSSAACKVVAKACWFDSSLPQTKENYMKRNTKKNAEKLAAEAINQMDLDALYDAVRDQLETYYGTLSNEDFNAEWEQIFGED